MIKRIGVFVLFTLVLAVALAQRKSSGLIGSNNSSPVPGSTVSTDTNSITWENPAPIAVEMDVRVRTTDYCERGASIWDGSIGPHDKYQMSCDNHEGVCYRFRHPQANEDFRDWFAVACRGQTMKVPYGY